LKLPDDDFVGSATPSVKDAAPPPEGPQKAKLIQGLKEGLLTIHPGLSRQAFGSDDDTFIKGIMNQILQLAYRGEQVDIAQSEFIAAALVGINPKDELEGMLATQIIANHILTMKFAGKLFRADNFNQQEVIEKVYTKLARTMPAQMEALHRKRHGGKQKVKVEHVHVYQGGQAIVGNVETGGGVGSRNQT